MVDVVEAGVHFLPVLLLLGQVVRNYYTLDLGEPPCPLFDTSPLELLHCDGSVLVLYVLKQLPSDPVGEDCPHLQLLLRVQFLAGCLQ